MGRVAVRLQPRARSDEIVGERAGALVIRVTAPPVDGAANTALCRLVAKAVGVPAGRVTVLRGASARDKLLEIEGVDTPEIRQSLGLHP